MTHGAVQGAVRVSADCQLVRMALYGGVFVIDYLPTIPLGFVLPTT